MTVPYYKQKTPYTCGPASFRMALDYMGIKEDENNLARLLETTEYDGTWEKKFPKVAENYRLNYIVNRNSSIRDLKALQDLGYVIILSYYYPKLKVYHYAVLKGIDSKNVYLMDPWVGPNHKYSIKYFNKIWKTRTHHGKEKKWMFGIMRPSTI